MLRFGVRPLFSAFRPPMSPSSSDGTTLLEEARSGEPVLDDLMPLIYDELRRLARTQRRRLGPHKLLNTTALVHEAYLKLAGRENTIWEDRRHFFRIAARIMRDILVDHARRQRAAKRGGTAPHVALDDLPPLPDLKVDDVLGIDESLDRLDAVEPRQARVVELRYFVGLTIEEAAEVLDVSPATVKRDWTSARAWLYRELRSEP